MPLLLVMVGLLLLLLSHSRGLSCKHRQQQQQQGRASWEDIHQPFYHTAYTTTSPKHSQC
jgi:hypothetical protein